MARVATNPMSAIANYLQQQNYASTDQIVAATRIDRAIIVRELRQMCQDGLVLEVAQNHWAKVPRSHRSKP